MFIKQQNLVRVGSFVAVLVIGLVSLAVSRRFFTSTADEPPGGSETEITEEVPITTLTGRLISSDGQPIERLVIEYETADNFSITDSDGRFIVTTNPEHNDYNPLAEISGLDCASSDPADWRAEHTLVVYRPAENPDEIVPDTLTRTNEKITSQDGKMIEENSNLAFPESIQVVCNGTTEIQSVVAPAIAS